VIKPLVVDDDYRVAKAHADAVSRIRVGDFAPAPRDAVGSGQDVTPAYAQALDPGHRRRSQHP